MRRFFWSLFAAAAFSLALATASSAAPNFKLVENAALVHPGHNSLTAAQVTTTGTPFTWGAVDFSIPPNLKLRQLNDLATDYKFVLGSCWGGSPRFEAWVNNGGATHKIFFFIGPPPSWTGCQSGVYLNTGNLATPTGIVDDSQLPGAPQYEMYGHAQSEYGDCSVTAIYLDADGGWYSNQIVDFDNTRVNGEFFTYESRR